LFNILAHYLYFNQVIDLITYDLWSSIYRIIQVSIFHDEVFFLFVYCYNKQVHSYTFIHNPLLSYLFILKRNIIFVSKMAYNVIVIKS